MDYKGKSMWIKRAKPERNFAKHPCHPPLTTINDTAGDIWMCECGRIWKLSQVLSHGNGTWVEMRHDLETEVNGRHCFAFPPCLSEDE